MRRAVSAGLLLAIFAGIPGFGQPSPSSLAAAPDTLTVRHLEAPPAPDPLPSPRWGSASAVVDGKLYVLGGFNGDHWTDDALSFDPATGHWTKLAPMPVSTLGISAAVLGREIIVPDATLASNHTFLYDPRSNVWRPGPPLAIGRLSTKLLAASDGAVAMSGTDQNGHGIATIETLIGGRWKETGSMPFVRDGLAAAAWNGKIYVAGGYDSSPGSVEAVFRDLNEYDSASRRWRPLAPMPTPRFSCTAAAFDGRIYVVGGQGEARAPWSAVNAVEAYDPETNAWSAIPPLPKARHHPVVAALGGRLYVVGGSPQGQGGTVAVQVYDPGARSWSIYGDEPPSAWTTTPAPHFVAVPRPVAAPARFERKSPESPHDFALVIGIGSYQHLPPADFAENDARDMALAFGALGVPEENVVSLTGPKATLSEISKYVEEWLPRRVSKDSRVYVYFSGHGSPDVKDGSAYLMPWDGDAAFVKSTGFPLTRLYQALGALPARHVVALIDSCFSGAGGRSVLVAGARPLVTVRLPTNLPPGISVLTASESEEIAGSLPERGHGLFSYYALQGLSGAADSDGKGHVTLEELYAYVHKHVILDARRQNREQTPTLFSPTPKLRLY